MRLIRRRRRTRGNGDGATIYRAVSESINSCFCPVLLPLGHLSSGRRASAVRGGTPPPRTLEEFVDIVGQQDKGVERTVVGDRHGDRASPSDAHHRRGNGSETL